MTWINWCDSLVKPSLTPAPTQSLIWTLTANGPDWWPSRSPLPSLPT